MFGIAIIASVLIARSTYEGYNVTKSPTLLRLFLAFLFISIGFILFLTNSIINAELFLSSLIMQIIGYFFLAFSYSIQSSGFKHMVPAIALISIALSPLFVIPGDSIEHIIRSISFVMIVYGATNAMISYMMNKHINTLITANGLALLALGEFVSWYGFIYPESIFYQISLALKVGGLVTILMPIYRITRGVRIGNV
ncbi:MAG: hypothetical protein KatS3mg003_0928 [Candidatus Nitrosocaldaceae archaeon]|nr:MAG: hypothetical protein KatS3mg003_0928 [Candidatus Nitrosocaldaceae archaeon]